MSVRIRMTQARGDLKVGDIIDAIEIDNVGDARVRSRDKYKVGYGEEELDWVFAGEFAVIHTDPLDAQRIEELEAEVARLRKLVPTVDQLPQEIGVWKSGGTYYVRLGEDNWLYASPYEVVRRTDAEMARGTRDSQGVPLIGEKIS